MNQSQMTWTRITVLAAALMLSRGLGAITERSAVRAPQGNEAKNVVAESTNDFGFDLYRRFARASNGGNLFFSPYSLSAALTMAATGARGETAREMATVLHLPEEGIGATHAGHRQLKSLFDTDSADPEQRALVVKIRDLKAKIAPFGARIRKLEKQRKWRDLQTASSQERQLVSELNQLLRKVKGHRLSVANALYCDKSYPLSRTYVNTLQSTYDTGAVAVADFRHNAAAAINSINAWVRERTEQRIDNLVGPDTIDGQTRLVLLNAVHFQAEWLEPFLATGTQPRPFTQASGAKSDVQMMRHLFAGCRYGAFTATGKLFATPRMVTAVPGGATEQTYPERGFHVVELPYRGGELSMVVFVPLDPAGLPALEAKLSSNQVDNWLDKLARRRTTVSLPKFESEQSYDVATSLKALGMRTAFDRNRADFSGMTSSKSPRDGFFLSGVVHKAFLSVDEKGTEATAATAIMMAPTSAAPGRKVPFVPHLNANRPFVYMIRDMRSGTVLFLGRFVTPL
tara:strand:- start:106928 stop:108469 length:1542 start_codon:yes stop_codon:yes gene_type:complete